MRVFFRTQDETQSIISYFLMKEKKPEIYPEVMTISVSQDRTPMPLAELKRLKAAAKLKVESRELRWTVQFRSDIPKLVQMKETLFHLRKYLSFSFL